MNRAYGILIVGLVAAGPAVAQDLTLKPGLWQVTMTRQVVDGRDLLAERAARMIKLKEALANLPPERRRDMEQQLGGVARVCISAKAAGGIGAGESLPGMGGCNPEKVVQSGASTTYEFHCEARGLKISGQGERTTTPTGVHTRSETVSIGPSGRRASATEADLVYLGSDCQGIGTR